MFQLRTVRPFNEEAGPMLLVASDNLPRSRLRQLFLISNPVLKALPHIGSSMRAAK